MASDDYKSEIDWIREWTKENAPDLRKVIGKPISATRLSKLKHTIGVLPDNYLACLAIMDGQSNEFGEVPSLIPAGDSPYSLFNSKTVLEQFNQHETWLMDKRKPKCGPAVQPVWYDRYWIEIAGDGDTVLAIDMNPSPKGKKGQIIQAGYDWPVRRALWGSFADFFGSLSRLYRDDLVEWDNECDVIRLKSGADFPDLSCPE